MTKIIKFVWEFRGIDSLGTAKHHIIHLKEYSKKEGFVFSESEIESINESLTIAFLKIKEPDAQKAYNLLKPDRAEIVK